ncbi:hypothetical protein [Paenibacillus sp. GYB003]|uniref:hypothetical protein n=1 Tax=Paenibacillus sp. GYB003 TaxID=2994392 RepID=UPI002F960BD1
MPDDANHTESNEAERTPSAASDYEKLFVLFSNRAERLLRGAIWTGLALLVAAQLLLAVPAVRAWMVKVERLEGVPFERAGSGGGP